LKRAACGALAVAAVAASLAAAPGLSGLLGGALAVISIAIAVADARRFVIPDPLVLGALGLGLLHATLAPPEGLAWALIGALMRGLAVALAFLALLKGYEWLRGREGMGLGDVKLAGVAGVWLDWPALTLSIEIAAVAALAVIGLRAWQGRRVSATTPVPFGAFFAPAIWLAWLLQASVLSMLW
jgi:leader peptidase (prepilin peptidase)/N-methyltransferase